ncbi:hypothetical protein B0A55_09585 [Friedmanniomyces simplex]|uniref:Uncharacterized protein n=1 Tax=Friedmanniomyces simplex TaxID=329884 RepID=A0A4U0X461_9PEZI|nr:hypothetical protein B0A55_09585 [Friedmanniomyces simplex]
MPREGRGKLPGSYPASSSSKSSNATVTGPAHHLEELLQDHNSLYFFTTQADRQPLFTPATTTPGSEADMTETKDEDLERLAADFTELAVNIGSSKTQFNNFFNASLQLRQTKRLELSRIDDLRTRARQMGRRLDFADASEPAAARGAATAATTPDQNHYPEDANNTETRIDQLYEQLAATQRQVDQLTLRLQEGEFESTAQAKQVHDLTAELATLGIEVRDGHVELTEGHANHGDGLTKLHDELAELRDQHPTVESRMTKQTGSQQRRQMFLQRTLHASRSA